MYFNQQQIDSMIDEQRKDITYTERLTALSRIMGEDRYNTLAVEYWEKLAPEQHRQQPAPMAQGYA